MNSRLALEVRSKILRPLQVYDGNEKNPDKLMDKLCGDIAPNRTFSSSSHQLLVVMESDSSIELSGFKARYSTVRKSMI